MIKGWEEHLIKIWVYERGRAGLRVKIPDKELPDEVWKAALACLKDVVRKKTGQAEA